jgi:hypothetical protein
VRIQTSDNVIQAIAINVVDEHLRRTLAKIGRMQTPNRVIFQRGRLLPPAANLDKIRASIAVDIAKTQAVRIFVPGAFRRDGMEFPRLGWPAPIWGGIAQEPAGIENQFRLPIARQVAKVGRLIINDWKGEVFGPWPGFALGIYIPKGLLARDVDDEDVTSLVLIEIVSEGNKVV